MVDDYVDFAKDNTDIQTLDRFVAMERAELQIDEMINSYEGADKELLLKTKAERDKEGDVEQTIMKVAISQFLATP